MFCSTATVTAYAASFPKSAGTAPSASPPACQSGSSAVGRVRYRGSSSSNFLRCAASCSRISSRVARSPVPPSTASWPS